MMIGRVTIACAALVALAACAGMESAGRSSRAADPVMSAPPPAPAPAAPAPEARAPAPAPIAPVLAQAEDTPAPAPSRGGEDEVVIPGAVERQVPPPNGDPRSRAERMEDVGAWDRCVTNVQGAFESDPTRPQLDSPEDVCRRSLGMSSRDAVPESRLRRR